jgi:hypothetical protein
MGNKNVIAPNLSKISNPRKYSGGFAWRSYPSSWDFAELRVRNVVALQQSSKFRLRIVPTAIILLIFFVFVTSQYYEFDYYLYQKLLLIGKG